MKKLTVHPRFRAFINREEHRNTILITPTLFKSFFHHSRQFLAYFEVKQGQSGCNNMWASLKYFQNYGP